MTELKEKKKNVRKSKDKSAVSRSFAEEENMSRRYSISEIYEEREKERKREEKKGKKREIFGREERREEWR